MPILIDEAQKQTNNNFTHKKIPFISSLQGLCYTIINVLQDQIRKDWLQLTRNLFLFIKNSFLQEVI